jgi:hypothetical protein
MGTYGERTGRTKRVILQPRVRAYWSRARAWHGEKVTLFVEAKLVPDGAKAKIAIHEEGDEEAIVEIPDQLTIDKGRASLEYTIQWDEETLGKKLSLKSPRREFVFVVTIDDVGVRAVSNRIYVHLHDFVIST